MVNVGPGGSIPLLAHQGGWDEILLVLAPIAVVGALLWVARRRVARADEAGGRASADPEGRQRAR
jgi:Zn-dependent protease with chaperone function